MLWMQSFKRYFEFSGRSGRAEYWQFLGVVFVAVAVGGLLDAGSESAARSGIPTLGFIVLVGCLIPTYAVTFRRLHDRNMTGWLVGVMWVFNIVGYVVGNIKDGISSSILAAPFVLIYWAVVLVQLALAVYLLIEVSKPGDEGPNQYGPPPVTPIATVPPAPRADAPRAGQSLPEADTLRRLERLADLRRQGALTDAEYDQQKAAVLRG